MAQGKALTIEEKKERYLAKMDKPVEAVEVVTAEGARKTRKKRGTFNGSEGKMSVNNLIPGYHLHWLNDEGGRITQAQDNGYEFVTATEVGGVVNSNVTDRNTDLGEKVRVLVGRTEQGNPLYAYLMKIEQEWYDEDQRSISARNDKTDDAIRGGKVLADGQTSDGFYLPKGGIKMQT